MNHFFFKTTYSYLQYRYMGSTVQYLLISNCASGGPGSGKITHCEQLSRNGLLSPHPLQSPEPQLPPCQPWQQICQDSPIFKHRPFGTITVFNVNFLLAFPKLLRVGCNHKKAVLFRLAPVPAPGSGSGSRSGFGSWCKVALRICFFKFYTPQKKP